MRKPYLLSVGVAIPTLGVNAHKYVEVRRHYRLRWFRKFGVSVVWTSYRLWTSDPFDV